MRGFNVFAVHVPYIPGAMAVHEPLVSSLQALKRFFWR
jgi:hypothetical protein